LNIKQKFFIWLGNQINHNMVESTSPGPNIKSRRASLAAHFDIGNDSSSLLDGNPLRLSIHRANGGVVVETRTIDKAKDRVYNELFLITEDQDLGKELADIITMNNLKH
jgi:hypothetical protein